MGVSLMESTVSPQRPGIEKRPIDLLIADHSPMDCQLLKNAFRRPRFPVRVVACAVSQSEIMRSIDSHSPDVALISDGLQDGPLTGFGVLRELRDSLPKTRVVVLLKSAREDLVIDAFRAGARGVFCKRNLLRNCASVFRPYTRVRSGQTAVSCVPLWMPLPAPHLFAWPTPMDAPCLQNAKAMS